MRSSFEKKSQEVEWVRYILELVILLRGFCGYRGFLGAYYLSELWIWTNSSSGSFCIFCKPEGIQEKRSEGGERVERIEGQVSPQGQEGLIQFKSGKRRLVVNIVCVFINRGYLCSSVGSIYWIHVCIL